MALLDFSGHTGSLPVDGSNKHFVIKNIVDCSRSVADGGWGTLATADTAKVLKFKEGWLVRRVWVRIIQKGTIGNTVLTDLGDSVGAAVWMAADLNIGANGTNGKVQGTLHTDTNGATMGYLYLADDSLIMAISTANFDGILEFAAEVIDVFGGLTIS